MYRLRVPFAASATPRSRAEIPPTSSSTEPSTGLGLAPLVGRRGARHAGAAGVHRPVRAGQDHARRRRPRGRVLPGHALPLLRRQARARARGRWPPSSDTDHRRSWSTPAAPSPPSPTPSSPWSRPRRRELVAHDALQFLLAHEPEAILGHLAFGAGRSCARRHRRRVRPRLRPRGSRPPTRARAGDWLTRVLRSYVLMPHPPIDLTDPADARVVPRTYS